MRHDRLDSTQRDSFRRGNLAFLTTEHQIPLEQWRAQMEGVLVRLTSLRLVDQLHEASEWFEEVLCTGTQCGEACVHQRRHEESPVDCVIELIPMR